MGPPLGFGSGAPLLVKDRGDQQEGLWTSRPMHEAVHGSQSWGQKTAAHKFNLESCAVEGKRAPFYMTDEGHAGTSGAGHVVEVLKARVLCMCVFTSMVACES